MKPVSVCRWKSDISFCSLSSLILLLYGSIKSTFGDVHSSTEYSVVSSILFSFLSPGWGRQMSTFFSPTVFSGQVTWSRSHGVYIPPTRQGMGTWVWSSWESDSRRLRSELSTFIQIGISRNDLEQNEG